jgi:hypothetical protein
VTISQQAVAPALGVLTISNLNYNVVSGATSGPVTVECAPGLDINPSPFYFAPLQDSMPATGADFDAFVSNAIIGSQQQVVISAKGSGGTTYSTSSQILAKGQKLTVTFTTSPKLAGEKIGIWLEVRQRGAKSFGAFKPHATIVLDTNGVGTYTYVASSGVKIGLQGRFVGNSSLMPASSYPTIFGLFQ